MRHIDVKDEWASNGLKPICFCFKIDSFNIILAILLAPKGRKLMTRGSAYSHLRSMVV